MSCRYKNKCKGYHASCNEKNCCLALRTIIEDMNVYVEENHQENTCMLDCRDAEIKQLKKENTNLKAKLKNVIEIPDKRIYEKDGDSAYYIDDGDITEIILSSPIIDRNGELQIDIFADDCVFPYRKPDPEHDNDPQDWCSDHKQIGCNELGKTLFFTREEAEKALKEREQNENV